MTKPGRETKPQGHIRRSQVLTTFGPGAMIDLPKHSVIVGGLDEWRKATERIDEPRLLQKVCAITRNPATELRAPPVDPQNPDAPATGITCWLFPEWFVTQETFERPGGMRFRYLVPRNRLGKGSKYEDRDRRKHSVVPIRFVQACNRGHVSDIDWNAFVHRGGPCAGDNLLSVEERGTSGDLGESYIRCECGVEPRRLLDAQEKDMKALGLCNGRRPWLGPYTAEKCELPSKLLIRSASNSYFPMLLRVISLPDADQALQQRLGELWDDLRELESVEDLKFVRRKIARLREGLAGLSDAEVWEAIEARKLGEVMTAPKSVKQAEFEAITAEGETLGKDLPDSDFYGENLKVAWTDPRFAEAIERVVLVHRLREVSALVGFTRFDAITPDIDGELSSEVVRASIATEASWRPAIENRGEGFFLQFRKSVVDEWAARPAVEKRARELDRGFAVWKSAHPQSQREFPGSPYYFLHTLSHLLTIAVSLECGYSLGSLRERVFSLPAGYGILIYTATPDAEGTLGGLVDAGRAIERLLQSALETGRLCSNDPVCSHHNPKTRHDDRNLHGAACHGCLLISETSCEQFNDFLDRELVVPTVGGSGAAFFA